MTQYEPFLHTSVLLDEAVNAWSFGGDGRYIDGTFGRGGHSRALAEKLGSSAELLVMDQDPEAIAEATHWAKTSLSAVRIHHGRFSIMDQVAEQFDWQGQITGILLDLGVSSPQLDNPERGFSFRLNGKLDMRFDPTQGISAAEWVNTVDENEIIRVLFEYGEERFARRIATQIIHRRRQEPIQTTAELAALIDDAVPRREVGKHPATRSFQAIRIAVNRELDELNLALEAAHKILKPGGRLVVISFHSLEDRCVKQFIQKKAKGDSFPR
ncbi:MAG: 16S rRNA (cytosine(1402)-N(4))-methyltransferase RsmH, partial [Pseudomonadota bacterium]